LPPEQQAHGPVSLRYEDVALDGRLMLDAIPHGLGEVMWQSVIAHHPMRAKLIQEGIVPILTRIVVEGLDSPIAVGRPLEGSGAFQLAHTVDELDAVNRIVLNMWVDVHGKRGLTYGPPPARAGESIHVGRVFAEHVFTRLFAPKEQRKVLSLAGVTEPAVPPARHASRNLDELVLLPDDAVALDHELLPDAVALCLGTSHTDSNQHVNSLVYPRFFEEAALRRFDAHGLCTAVMSRFVEMAFRKPSFAGDRVRVALRTFEWRGMLGAVGVLLDDRTGDPRPRAIGRMLFQR
jgi:hypothetical protein